MSEFKLGNSHGSFPWLRLPLYTLLWSLRAIVELPFWLIGVVLVPTLLALRLYKERDSLYFTDETTGKPRRVLVWKGGWLTWLWGNEEDGIDGAYYGGTLWDEQRAGFFKRAFFWSALRNAVSNFRFLPVLNPRIEPARVWGRGVSHPTTALKAWRTAGGAEGPAFWSFAGQGLYAGFSFKKPTGPRTHHRFMVGWKIYPEDAHVAPEAFINTSRYPRCGFGLQFTWNREEAASSQ